MQLVLAIMNCEIRFQNQQQQYVIYEVWFVWLFQNVAAWARMREAFFARCVVYKCSTVSHDILVPDDGVESPSPSDSCDSQVTSASTRLAIPSTDRSIMAALL